jgi:anti-sigma regulatory factor (Ser/Thr protein kinase)
MDGRVRAALMNGRVRAAGADAQLGAPVDSDASQHGAFQHLALLYEDEHEYLAEVPAFVRAALVRGDPVLVAVPGSRIGQLREVLGAESRRVVFVDMAEAGRNPGRLIGAMRDFADSRPGRRVSAVGGPAWAARSPGELREAARHEALSNLALADVPMTALCPYDAARLPADVLTAAEQTHPLLACPGGPAPSTAFLGSVSMPAQCLAPLPPPPPGAQSLGYITDLAPVRQFVIRRAALAGLPPHRASDLVIAVSELAANTLCHTRGGGTVRVWRAGDELVCEVADRGWIRDPLAGRQLPAGNSGGYGLWVVNQVCDLVETRSGPAGTTTRCHLSLQG